MTYHDRNVARYKITKIIYRKHMDVSNNQWTQCSSK